MKLYIPPHLKNIPIIDQLTKLIEGYSIYYENQIGSFEDYNSDLASDPVKLFINLCIDSKINKEEQDFDSILNYLTKLFYSVKGSVKVFEYMQDYLFLDIIKVTYTIENIFIELSGISINDENLFYTSLKEFLNALLYFKNYNTIIETVDLTIEGEVKNVIGINILKYNETTAEIWKL